MASILLLIFFLGNKRVFFEIKFSKHLSQDFNLLEAVLFCPDFWAPLWASNTMKKDQVIFWYVHKLDRSQLFVGKTMDKL
jgi:hypothetical protein